MVAAVGGNRSVWKLQCVGVAVNGSRSEWELLWVRVAVDGIRFFFSGGPPSKTFFLEATLFAVNEHLHPKNYLRDSQIEGTDYHRA